MPPRRATATLIPNDDIVDVEFDTDAQKPPTKTDAEHSFDSLLEQLQDDVEAFISIYRLTSNGEIYAARIPADKYDLPALQEYLQEELGGGDFRLRVYRNKKLFANKLLQIEKKKINKENSSNSYDSLIRDLLDKMEANNQKMLELIQQKNNVPQKSTTEVLNELLLMKQIVGGGQQVDPMVQLSATIETLKSIGVQIGGIQEKDENEGFGGMLEKLAPLATAIISSKNNSPNIRQQNPQPQKQDKTMLRQQMIKAAINDLLRAAKKQREVSVYAEEVVERVPENILRNLVSTNFVEEMSKVNAEVITYAAWFVELGEHVKAQLGMPSTVDHLYSDDESDINDENSGDTIENEHL